MGVFALACAVAAPAQDGAAAAASSARRATFVRVESLDGAPVADATVTFAGHVPHLVGFGGATDVQRVQADAAAISPSEHTAPPQRPPSGRNFAAHRHSAALPS